MIINAFFKSIIFVCGFGLCLASKNVLFLMIDDLRPQLNAYAGEHFPSSVSPPMITPNIDKIAGESILFKRAYVQQAVCSPSRSSLLTGRRPDTTHVYDLSSYFRDVGGDFTTIPQYFKENGYRSIGMGKIFHPGADSGNDDPLSWSDPYFHGTANFENRQKSWDAVPDTDLVSRPLRDMQVADEAIDRIRELAASDENFFLAVGFHKPHEPFVFPESFLSNYSADSISLPDNDQAPDQMPEVAWSTYSGLRTFQDIEVFNPTGDIGTVLPDDVVKDLRRAYYATVSYIDTLVGKIYDELEAQQLLDDTIISLVGDHGYQLGEHGEWGKRTNFELSTHAPMMIRVPGKTENGIVTEQLVEFVDLFPTLAEAAGLGTIPQCPENSENEALCHEGESLMPLIDNPDTPIKKAAFSQTPSPYPGSGRIMGYTMRTEQYRYTEWVAFRYNSINEPNWNQVSEVELYDHINDSDENFNIAASADPSLVSELSQQLRDGWRKADPTAKRILDGQDNTDADKNNEKSLLQRLYYFLSHWK